MSIEEASKRLEVTFKETERRLDVIGDKVDSALVDCENQKGSSIVPATVSATQLLKQVHDVKTEFKTVVDQVGNLKNDHEEFITEILQELKNVTLAAESLKSLGVDESNNAITNEKEQVQPALKQKGKKK